jgi:hypothetical protein
MDVLSEIAYFVGGFIVGLALPLLGWTWGKERERSQRRPIRPQNA